MSKPTVNKEARLMVLTKEMIALGKKMQDAKNTYAIAEERVKQITGEIQELAK